MGIKRQGCGAYLMVAILHGLWDGLPGVVSAILVAGMDVFIGQALVGGIGLFLLWRRRSEAFTDKTDHRLGIFG